MHLYPFDQSDLKEYVMIMSIRKGLVNGEDRSGIREGIGGGTEGIKEIISGTETIIDSGTII